jgi:exodeoxyribonuclease VIII
MLDLETLGNNSQSPILSIGAVAFDPMGNQPVEKLPSFYCNVQLQSCFDAGLKPDASTVLWWFQQSEEARLAVTEPPVESLVNALCSFSAFFFERKFLWSHATFDVPILANAYRAIGVDLPWHYRAARDIRTLQELAEKLGYRRVDRPAGTEVEHNALADARNQVYYTRLMYQTVMRAVPQEQAA